MTVSALWTVACVVTPFLIILCQPTAAAAAGAGQTGGSGCKGDVKELHIIGFYPFEGVWSGGESQNISTQLAIEQINNMCVVPGYRLKLHVADSKCDAGVVLYEFYKQLFTPPTKLLIHGPACSFVTETVARAAHYWNLVQMSLVSLSPILSNKALFPTFARINAPDATANPARVQLLRHFGWTTVATLYQNFEIFTTTVDDLSLRLKDVGITVKRSEVFTDKSIYQVRNLVNDDCRIILAFFYEIKARQVFCDAYREGLYGRRVVWVLSGWLEKNWWRTRDDTINCTAEEMETAVHGYFDVAALYYNRRPQRSVSGWLPADFKAEYMKRAGGRTLFGHKMRSLGYESMWALALALNATRHALLANGSSKGLENFTYDDKELSTLLFRSLLNLSFMGLMGPVSFDASGDPVAHFTIHCHKGDKRIAVGYFNSTTNAAKWTVNNSKLWEGGVPPRSTLGKDVQYQTVSVWVYVAMCLLAALGIVLALVFLAFNIVMRNVRVVKNSAPTMNNVILLGCIFCYASIFSKDEGAGHGVLGCEIHILLLEIGVSLAIGALFAKTWRVHAIYANEKARVKKKIKTDANLTLKIMTDRQLMGMVAVLVIIKLIVLATWWLTDPMKITVTSTFTTRIEDKAGDIEISHHERSCESDNHIYFTSVLYGIHVLLLLCGTLLAFETRSVHCPELNDSKLIGMCIYNVALLSIPGIVLNVALNPELNFSYAISSSIVILGATVTQCTIFIPKLADSYNDIQGYITVKYRRSWRPLH